MNNKGNGNITRVHKETNFTVVHNDILKDKNISFKAKGLLISLLSFGSNWQFSENGLVAISNDGKSSVRSGLAELEEKKYLVREIERNEKGQFVRAVYNVYEKPLLDNRKMDKPTLDNVPNKETTNKELNNKETNTINVDLDYKTIIDYLNEKANTKYKNVVGHQKFIRARYNEGYTLEDFKKVIDNKVRSWAGTEYEQYLRPQTLFSNKFDTYLNEKHFETKGVLNNEVTGDPDIFT